jgi:hypothetical protein
MMNKLLLLILVVPFWVQAKDMSFANNEAKRQQTIDAWRRQAVLDKNIAVEWANKKGVPIRIDTGTRLMELMKLENGKPIYYTTYNVESAISTTTDLVRNAAPFDVNGSNAYHVGVWDGGSILYTHQEFAGGRVVLKDVVDSHPHSTHVGGTIGAAGVESTALGMAPAIFMDSYDWSNDQNEMYSVAASSPGNTNKIYISNHSYGFLSGWDVTTWYGSFTPGSGGVEYAFGQYNTYTRNCDIIGYNCPYYLQFWAAGNDRNNAAPSTGTTFTYYDGNGDPQTYVYDSTCPEGDGVYKDGFDNISYGGIAKNILSVGAVYPAVTPAITGTNRYLGNAIMSPFSSWGPADDGRIKPDIVAVGVGVWSTTATDSGSNTNYDGMSGTSMASPNAAGSAALLTELYKKYFSTDMRASTLKGLIIHTADDLGRPGPDYVNGWGLMNTKNAAYILKSLDDGDNIRVQEELLNTSTDPSKTYKLYSDGTKPIRVTLCWTDPPGTSTTANDSRTPVLVNDLDLKVISGTTTNYPYSLSYASPTANATAVAENNIDNVEQVYIETPTAGDYTILVDYDGSLYGSQQWFSLIVSGNIKQGSVIMMR